VCNAPYGSSSHPFCKVLHWLPIEQRIQYKIAVMTCKVRLHRQSQYLRELINDYLPARSLRSSNNGLLIIPSTKTVTAAHAFRVAVPHIWNNLPITIRNAKYSTNSATCWKDTCSTSSSVRHDYPAPLYCRHYRWRIMAPLTKMTLTLTYENWQSWQCT